MNLYLSKEEKSLVDNLNLNLLSSQRKILYSDIIDDDDDILPPLEEDNRWKDGEYLSMEDVD